MEGVEPTDRTSITFISAFKHQTPAPIKQMLTKTSSIHKENRKTMSVTCTSTVIELRKEAQNKHAMFQNR